MSQLAEFTVNHILLTTLFAVLVVMLILGEIRRLNGVATSVGPADATRMINHDNAIMLDIREDKEHAEGKIINSQHIPLSQLDSSLKRLEKYKNRPIITYCRSGNRSNSAAAKLRKQGFEKVYNLRGGVVAWQRDNLPLVKT
ncbi:MAG TPA: rhodanese-like domain-containing protein [Gammaproteobacteria bacterium]|nr:rhodanese-like domain-containing protein [Gammaproteobacteria bacterium]